MPRLSAITIAVTAIAIAATTAQAAPQEKHPHKKLAMRWYWNSGAQCVKSKEGAWTSNTGNGYYGGFQADHDFQRAYGREFYHQQGTANNWEPWQQIVMAWRGWRDRGWQPWPTTSVMCGLR
jgi:hypothetical protein